MKISLSLDKLFWGIMAVVSISVTIGSIWAGSVGWEAVIVSMVSIGILLGS